MADFLDSLYRGGGVPHTGAVPQMAGLTAAGAPNAAAVAAATPRAAPPAPTAPQASSQAAGGQPGGLPSNELLAQLQAILDVQGQAAPQGVPGGPAQGGQVPTMPLDQTLAAPPPPTILTEPPTEGALPDMPPDPVLGFQRANENYDLAFYRKRGRWPRPEDYEDEMWTLDQFQRTKQVPSKVEYIMRRMTPMTAAPPPDYTVSG